MIAELKEIWKQILKMFGLTTITSETQRTKNVVYTKKYEDIDNINFTAIFSNKLATLAVSESTVDIVGKNKRVELLDAISSSLWLKIKKIVSRVLGTGGSIIIPYVVDKNIYFNVVSQDRFCINKKQGEKIVSATILAEIAKENSKIYYRWTTYELNNSILTITNKTTNEYGNSAIYEPWESIQDISISNVERLPFAYIKSPVDNRETSDNYGVPITYGCEEIIKQILDCLKQIEDEYKLKKALVGVDEGLLDGNKQLPDGLFIKFNAETNEFWKEYSPDIRDSSYYNRLTNLFDMLEKAIGTSKGILTTPESRGATATEIKSGLYDTYSIVTDIRKTIELAYDDFCYACSVLANYYNITPQGDYEIAFDWSYSMIESSAETFAQYNEGITSGYISKAEARQYVKGGTLEECQKVIDEIDSKTVDINEL